MSVYKYEKIYTVGDIIESMMKNIFPYVKKQLDNFQAVEPHEFNHIVRTYLDHKRELTLNPTAVLDEDEVKALYNKFVEPDYYGDWSENLSKGVKYAREHFPFVDDVMNKEINDEDFDEIYTQTGKLKQTIDKIIEEQTGKSVNTDYNTLPFGSVENYESDFNDDLIVEMREIPEDEYININPYFTNFEDDDQGESVALYDEVINLDNINDYETEDDINFTTMDEYMKNVKSNFTDLKHSDFNSPSLLDYVKKYRIPIALGLNLGTYAAYKTYKWYKKRMNSGTDKTSKDYSTSNTESGATIEDKMKIHKLITNRSKVDVETMNKIDRLAGFYY